MHKECKVIKFEFLILAYGDINKNIGLNESILCAYNKSIRVNPINFMKPTWCRKLYLLSFIFGKTKFTDKIGFIVDGV